MSRPIPVIPIAEVTTPGTSVVFTPPTTFTPVIGQVYAMPINLVDGAITGTEEVALGAIPLVGVNNLFVTSQMLPKPRFTYDPIWERKIWGAGVLIMRYEALSSGDVYKVLRGLERRHTTINVVEPPIV